MLRFSHLIQTVKKVIICCRFGWINCLFYNHWSHTFLMLMWQWYKCKDCKGKISAVFLYVRPHFILELAQEFSSFYNYFLQKKKKKKKKKEYSRRIVTCFHPFNNNKCLLLCCLENCNIAIKPCLFTANHHKHAFCSFVEVPDAIVCSELTHLWLKKPLKSCKLQM